jgi:hypothetical protein
VYEHINYVGNQEIYALEPGMRQKLVRLLPNTVDDKISSIQVGANVGVAFFTQSDFFGTGNATLQSINNLSSTPEYHDQISSLIIFPKEWKYPMGVFITGKFWFDSQYGGSKIGMQLGKFFPAPEKMTDRIANYPDIGYQFENNNIDAYVRPDSMHPIYKQVFVKLCEQKNFGGKCITIPGPGGSIQQHFKLSDYQFENKVSSLQVIHNYPVSVSAKQPTPAVKQVPPVRTPVQKARKPIAANEVAVYEHINFEGNQEIYALEPGMRQKLVRLLPNTVDQKISSIQVGANVGVAFWTDSWFTATGNVTIQSINLSSKSEYNDRIRSIIIFPKEWAAPMGALLISKEKDPSTGQVFSQFFPAPEKMTDRIADNDANASYPLPGYVSILTYLRDKTDVVYVWPDKLNHPIHNQIYVKLCEQTNFKGKCITLPPDSGGSPSHTFKLSDYPYSGKVLSLQVIHNYPVSVKQPIPTRTPTQTPAVRMPVQRR